MDNEIFRSTLSSRKFASFYFLDEINVKSRWGVFTATFISNMVLSGLLMSYGIIIYARKGTTDDNAYFLITPCTFGTIWTLTESWFYNVTEGCNINSRVLGFIGVILSFIGIICNVWFDNIFYQCFFYGLIGGLGTSLVLSQIIFIIDELNQNSTKFKLLPTYGRAIGNCIIPYIFMVIFHFYGYSMGYLLISGLVLQVLPFILFLKNKKKRYKYGTYRRASSLFDDDFVSTSENVNMVPMTDLSHKSWRCPSRDNIPPVYLSSVDTDENELEYGPVDGERHAMRNHQTMGMLERIVEENEEEENNEEMSVNENLKADSKVLEKSIKRLSTLSVTLEDIITNDDINETNIVKLVQEPNRSEVVKKNGIFQRKKESVNAYKMTPPMLNCCCDFKISFARTLNYFKEASCYNLKVSLKSWPFYPVVLLKTSSSCLIFYYSSLVALMNSQSELSVSNISFIISMFGAAWFSFLVLSPWLGDIKKSKFKIVSSFGCIVSALGLLVIVEFNRLEFISLGSAVTGIGFGALSLSCDETAKYSIGARKFKKMKRTLDSITGLLIMGIGIWMSYLLTIQNGREKCFHIISSLLVLSGILWIVIIFIESLRKHKHNHHIWPHM